MTASGAQNRRGWDVRVKSVVRSKADVTRPRDVSDVPDDFERREDRCCSDGATPSFPRSACQRTSGGHAKIDANDPERDTAGPVLIASFTMTRSMWVLVT
jgi:hypothetical protein